jgi:hypothetical protein
MDKFDWLMAGIAVGAVIGAGVCVTVISRRGYITLGLREAARLAEERYRDEGHDRWHNEGGQG